MARNAVLVDTTNLSVKQMEDKLINLIRKSIKKIWKSIKISAHSI